MKTSIKSPTKAARARKSAKDKKKAAEASKDAKESITVWLADDIEVLHAEARKAGTTGTNLARIIIRDGLAKLASGKYKIQKVYEDGELPPELYDRACRMAESQGTTVTALFENAIKKAKNGYFADML